MWLCPAGNRKDKKMDIQVRVEKSYELSMLMDEADLSVFRRLLKYADGQLNELPPNSDIRVSNLVTELMQAVAK
jgi:hypothetical protein